MSASRQARRCYFTLAALCRKAFINPSTTQQMLSTYNAALRQYVTDNHFMDTFTFHPISGSEIIKRFSYPACH